MIILNKDGTPMERYLEHGKSGSMQRFYQSTAEGRKRLASLPVCPTCERVGFRDKGWGKDKAMCCPHCGYKGPCTHVVAAYLKEGCYK